MEKQKNKKKGLGDVVEDVIKTVAPKLAERFEDCEGCEKRKSRLNNFNANFWEPEK